DFIRPLWGSIGHQIENGTFDGLAFRVKKAVRSSWPIRQAPLHPSPRQVFYYQDTVCGLLIVQLFSDQIMALAPDRSQATCHVLYSGSVADAQELEIIH